MAEARDKLAATVVEEEDDVVNEDDDAHTSKPEPRRSDGPRAVPHNSTATRQSNIPPHDLDAEQSVLGAMMESRDAIASVESILSADDFYKSAHREVYRTILALNEAGEPADAITVANELARRGTLDEIGGKPYIHGLLEAYPTASSAGHYARIVQQHARHRDIIRATNELANAAFDRNDDAIDAHFAELHDAMQSTPAWIEVVPLNVEDFIAANTGDHEYEWLLPDVFERGDRLILTGREGSGKSLLLLQIATQLASGIHPFGGADFPPMRVLVIDLENSGREVARRLSPLKTKAGDRLDLDRLLIVSRPEGLDIIGNLDDGAWLCSVIAQASPDLVTLGPSYKLSSGDPNSEQDAKPVAALLDRIRGDVGCALLLEAHMPHETRGRPFGWSGWRRWPEIGIELTEKGLLKPWRTPRHETPGIPPMLTRGGEWPFTPSTRTRDAVWAQIVEACEGRTERPSIRGLADELDANRNAVSRAIEEHRDEWEAMFDAGE